MANNPPTNELIRFTETGATDSFPTVFNAGNSSVAERYTKVWAEYHNKIRNFIGIVEPLCNIRTAENQGISSLTYWGLNPAPTLYDILYGSAKKACTLTKAPPSNILPFEIVITSSTDDYTNWTKQGSNQGPVPMLYQAPSALINKIVYGNLFDLRPMVQCTIRSINETTFSTKWAVSSYCITGVDTLLIRGAIIDITGTAKTTAGLPPLTGTTAHFDGANQYLNVTIVGVRT